MNILVITGIVLAGAVIAYDHLIDTLPHMTAIVLFTIAIILIIAGMIKTQMKQ